MLTDRQIRARIAPRMVRPETQYNTFSEGVTEPGVISYGLTSAGYDFRLGENLFALTSRDGLVIDPKRFDKRIAERLTVHCADRYNEYGEFIAQERYAIIPPYGYALGETYEYLDLPPNIDVIVVGKSTYARSGVIVNVTPLEPGWRGVTTLEIANVTPLPVRVYVGEGICQAKFFELSERPEKIYGERSKRYQDQKGMEFAKCD